MKIAIEKIKAKAAERPPGYVEEYLLLGKVDGEFLHITPAAHRSMLAKYGPERLRSSTITPQPSTRLTGLGDAIALIAKPIARTIDKVAGTKLEKCGSCAKRQAKLNAALPFQKL